MTITQSELKRLLSYDPETGDFTWLGVGKKMSGKKAGSDCNGYLLIRINRKLYRAHRLAWLYVYGIIPATDLDHINCAKKDNRISNLRECSKSENKYNAGIMRSNVSGFKGVSWFKRDEKWKAEIRIDGKKKHLGYFDTAELASEAYMAKAKEVHGKFYHEAMK